MTREDLVFRIQPSDAKASQCCSFDAFDCSVTRPQRLIDFIEPPDGFGRAVAASVVIRNIGA